MFAPGNADGGTAAAAAAATGEAAAAEEVPPPSKRARTTTVPALPAPQDLQYMHQNLCWSSTNTAAASVLAAAVAAQPPVPAVPAPPVPPPVLGVTPASVAALMAAANIPLLGATNIMPSSAASVFLLPTPPIPDSANLTGSSSRNSNMINDSNKRPRQQQPPLAAAAAAAATENNKAIQQQHNKQEQRKRRNAINARLMRMRKKHAESMVDIELKALQRENEWLKNIVKREILPNDKAQQIINDCCYSSKNAMHHHSDGVAAATAMTAISSSSSSSCAARTGEPAPPQEQEQQLLLGHSDFELVESLAKSQQSFVLSDPRQVDNPIVYASCSFLRLTGYTREQVIGRNCRFLQGIHSDADQVAAIRQAVESGQDGAAFLVNYKADGTPFWNHFFITALRDKKNRVVNFVGVQTEVDKPLDGIEPMMPATAVAAAAAATTSSSSNPQESVESAAGSLTAKLAGFEQETLQRLLIDKSSANTIDMSKLQELEDENRDRKMPAVTCVPAPVQLPVDMFDDSSDVNMIDWSQLAEVLEADIDSDGEALDLDSVDEEETSDSYFAKSMNTAEDIETNILFEKSFFSFFTKAPRALVILTIRSEIVDCMTRNDGDISDPGFTSALALLSKLYQQRNDTDVIHGQWREISRPTYQHGGIIGTNERGDKVYALGKMSFNMFKPGNLRVTVQSTINCIEPKADDKALPAAVPWSLRRELAQQGEQPSSSKLKFYGKQQAREIYRQPFFIAQHCQICFLTLIFSLSLSPRFPNGWSHDDDFF
jgi:PAS domain S-box-containing protein